MLSRTPPPFAVTAPGGSVSSGTVQFSNSNGVSFGLNGSTLTGSVAAQTAQTQNVHNVTLAGNTAGVLAQISSGTLTLAGGNNITLSQNGNAVTISGGAGGGGNFSAGVSTGGNTQGNTGVTGSRLVFVGNPNITLSQNTDANGATITFSGGAGAAGNTGFISAGAATASLGTVVFSNSNGLSFGVNGQTVTGSYTVPTQTNQTVGVYGSSQTTGSASSGTYDARSLSVIGAGIVSVGNHSTSAGGTTSGLIISATQSNQALSGSNGSLAFQTATFGNLNGVSFYTSNGSMVASYTVPAQTAQTVGLYATSNTTQGTSGTQDARSLTFAGAGVASVGVTNGSVVVSVPAGGYSAGLSNIGNTAGDTGLASNRLVLAGGNNITLSGSTNGGSMTVTISAPNLGAGAGFSAGASNLGNTAGDTGVTGTRLVLVGSNLVSLSQATDANGGTVSFNATQSAQTIGYYATGNTTQNSSTTLDARSVTFHASTAGAVSMGFSNGSILVSAPQTSSLSATGLVSISTNVSTISIGGQWNLSAGTTSNNITSQVVFSNSNGVSFGLNGSTITASVAAGAALTNINVSAGTTSNNLSNVVLSNSNNVSFGLSGSTLTASASYPAPATLSQWPAVLPATTQSTYYSGSTSQGAGGGSTQSGYTFSVYVVPLPLPAAVSFSDLLFAVSNGTAAGTGSVSMGWSAGLYTRTGSTLSRHTDFYGGLFLSQNSISAQTFSVFTQTTTTSGSIFSSAGNVSAQLNGQKYVHADSGAGVTLPGSQYYLAFAFSSRSSGANVFTNVGIAQSSNVTAALNDLGENTASTSASLSGWGAFSTTYTSVSNAGAFFRLPASLNTSGLSSTSTGWLRYHYPTMVG